MGTSYERRFGIRAQCFMSAACLAVALRIVVGYQIVGRSSRFDRDALFLELALQIMHLSSNSSSFSCFAVCFCSFSNSLVQCLNSPAVRCQCHLHSRFLE